MTQKKKLAGDYYKKVITSDEILLALQELCSVVNFVHTQVAQ